MKPSLDLFVPLFVFNGIEARTVDAIASRIFPGDDQSGGAHEAEVVVYIDRTLAGPARHLQTFYRDRLRELDVYCTAQFGHPFVDLFEEDQDVVLGHLDTRDIAFGEMGRLPHPEPPGDAERPHVPITLRVFFNVLWEHTMQGMFCDPAYGGNKNAIGWRAIGFPGAQWSYGPEQRVRGFDATGIPIRTLTDLQRDRPWEAMSGLAGEFGGEGDAGAT